MLPPTREPVLQAKRGAHEPVGRGVRPGEESDGRRRIGGRSVPPVVAQAAGPRDVRRVHHAGRGRPRVDRLPLLQRGDAAGLQPPRHPRGGARERGQGVLHQLRGPAARAVRRPGFGDGPVRREGAARELGHGGHPGRAAPRARLHRPQEVHQVRGPLSRHARVRVLQLAQPARGGEAVGGNREGARHRRHGAGGRRPAGDHPVERHRGLRAHRCGAPRGAGRGDPRAGHVQRRLHRAAARLPAAAARDHAARGAALDLRRGAVGLPHAPGRRAGALRRHARPHDPGQGARLRHAGGRPGRQDGGHAPPQPRGEGRHERDLHQLAHRGHGGAGGPAGPRPKRLLRGPERERRVLLRQGERAAAAEGREGDPARPRRPVRAVLRTGGAARRLPRGRPPVQPEGGPQVLRAGEHEGAVLPRLRRRAHARCTRESPRCTRGRYSTRASTGWATCSQRWPEKGCELAASLRVGRLARPRGASALPGSTAIHRRQGTNAAQRRTSRRASQLPWERRPSQRCSGQPVRAPSSFSSTT